MTEEIKVSMVTNRNLIIFLLEVNAGQYIYTMLCIFTIMGTNYYMKIMLYNRSFLSIYWTRHLASAVLLLLRLSINTGEGAELGGVQVRILHLNCCL